MGITYRQLDYWARTDLLRPSVELRQPELVAVVATLRDLLELRVIKTLLDAGIHLKSVREVFAFLRRHVTADIASAHIVIAGNQVMLCEADQLVKYSNRPGTMNVLPLSGVKDDIDAQLLPPSVDDDDDNGEAGVLQPV